MAAFPDSGIILDISIPTLGISKKFSFSQTEVVGNVIRRVSADLGFPLIQSFGLLDTRSGRWCPEGSTLLDIGFVNSGEPIVYSCEMKIRKVTESGDLSGVQLLPGIPPESESGGCIQVELSHIPGRTVAVGINRGATVGMVLVLLRSDPETRPPGSQDEVDTFGLVSRITDRASGSHRLNLSLAESVLFGDSGFDSSSKLVFCPVKVCSHISAFFDPTDFHSQPTEISLSLESHCTISFLLQRLVTVANSRTDPNQLEIMLYFPNAPAFKNCGIILNGASALSAHGYLLHLRAATRPRLEGTMAMTANTMWLTITCSTLVPPLKVDALVDTNIKLSDLQDLFWIAHPGRKELSHEYAAFLSAGLKTSRSKSPKPKRAVDTGVRLRELGLSGGATIDIRAIGRVKTPSTLSSSSSALFHPAFGAGFSASSSSSSSSSGSHSSIDTALSKLQGGRSTGILIKDSYGLFGVELSSFPFSSASEGSSTINIPTFALQLRQSLRTNNGLTVDGIFRQGGSESVIKLVCLGLLAGSFDPEEKKGGDRIEFIHSLAALLKRWLGALPMPLFDGLKLADLRAANPSDIIAQLPQPNHDITIWLLGLLAETATYQRFNRMDASNLAIVFAPLVMKFPDEDVVAGVELTKAVTAFLQKLIEERIDKNVVPVIPVDLLPPPPPPLTAR